MLTVTPILLTDGLEDADLFLEDPSSISEFPKLLFQFPGVLLELDDLVRRCPILPVGWVWRTTCTRHRYRDRSRYQFLGRRCQLPLEIFVSGRTEELEQLGALPLGRVAKLFSVSNFILQLQILLFEITNLDVEQLLVPLESPDLALVLVHLGLDLLDLVAVDVRAERRRQGVPEPRGDDTAEDGALGTREPVQDVGDERLEAGADLFVFFSL